MNELGYGTYGMPGEPVIPALPRLRDIGYRAIELTVADGWPTAVEALPAAEARKVRDSIRDTGFPPPALLSFLPLVAADVGDVALADELSRIGDLARELTWDPAPVVLTSTVGAIPAERAAEVRSMGDSSGGWQALRDRLADSLAAAGEVCAQAGLVLAIEPHAGGVLDTPEKAAWLMERCGGASVKLNFDVSHFHVEAIPTAHAAAFCLPHAAHLHVKDGRKTAGNVEFLLPGEGGLDLTEYMRIVDNGAPELPVFLEVSGMVRRRADYDPWRTAAEAYAVLDRARLEAERL